MPIINIRVQNKIARSPVEHIVCGNTDYQILFDFDAEWGEYETKTARFVWDGHIEDVEFSGNVCNVPAIVSATICEVGVYAGDLHATTPALVRCHKSILCTKTGGSSAVLLDDKRTVIVQVAGEKTDFGTQRLTTTHTHDQILDLLNKGKNVILEHKYNKDGAGGFRYAMEYYDERNIMFINIFPGYKDGAYRQVTRIIETSKDTSNWTITDRIIQFDTN